MILVPLHIVDEMHDGLVAARDIGIDAHLDQARDHRHSRIGSPGQAHVVSAAQRPKLRQHSGISCGNTCRGEAARLSARGLELRGQLSQTACLRFKQLGGP